MTYNPSFYSCISGVPRLSSLWKTPTDNVLFASIISARVDSKSYRYATNTPLDILTLYSYLCVAPTSTSRSSAREETSSSRRVSIVESSRYRRDDFADWSWKKCDRHPIHWIFWDVLCRWKSEILCSGRNFCVLDSTSKRQELCYDDSRICEDYIETTAYRRPDWAKYIRHSVQILSDMFHWYQRHVPSVVVDVHQAAQVSESSQSCPSLLLLRRWSIRYAPITTAINVVEQTWHAALTESFELKRTDSSSGHIPARKDCIWLTAPSHSTVICPADAFDPWIDDVILRCRTVCELTQVFVITETRNGNLIPYFPLLLCVWYDMNFSSSRKK